VPVEAEDPHRRAVVEVEVVGRTFRCGSRVIQPIQVLKQYRGLSL
jgi:hypothetical protein